ncbi:MAG: metabolism ATPase/kinaselike protein [Bacteroidota bacterium]|jgi:NadR type nicotinamide-nucleotide adenylyltransferase|nr:metabolism ATPase/kinaselike protein [Bacteroidota bacterium]
MEKAAHSIKKIAILGAESTGKSVLCEQLAKHYQTVFVPEYARTYFDEHDINNYNTDDLEVIAKNQLELENEYLKKATNYLFCDTSLITVKIWSTHKFNKVPKFITSSIKPTDYDLYLIANNDVQWTADPQRRNEDLREHLFKWNKHELQKLNVDYKIIKGVDEERLQCAINLIDEAFKN